MRRVLVVFIALVVGTASLAFAQGDQTGTVRGRVTSSDGLALPGVAVTVSSPSLQGNPRRHADVNGVYSLPGLPAGEYTVHFELQGFAVVERHVTVPLGAPVVVDQALGPQPVHETVDVRGSMTAPAEVPSGSFNLRTDATRLLPVGRTPMLLAEITPGLTDNTPNQNQVTVGGGLAYDNAFLVDGVDVNDNVFGQPNGLFIEEGIQELQVLSSGISAEYGRFAGGVVNIVTRSGGDLFSGALRTNLMNSSWSADAVREVEGDHAREQAVSEVRGHRWRSSGEGPVVVFRRDPRRADDDRERAAADGRAV